MKGFLYGGQKAEEPIEGHPAAHDGQSQSPDGSFFNFRILSAVNISPLLHPVTPLSIFFSFDLGAPSQNEGAREKNGNV